MRRTFRDAGRPQRGGRRRFVAAIVAGGAQLAVAAALLWQHRPPSPPPPQEPPLQVRFVALPRPPGLPAAPDGEGAPFGLVTPPLPAVTAPVVTIARTDDTSDLLSDSELAGAAHVGEGGAGEGGGCDMARAVQQALRRDGLVRRAVAEADRLGKASMLWNGDWVRAGGEEGKGLSAVREAVAWEVAFAPAACRNARMHGLVLLSLADGRTRFAIGAAQWRWSDLLGVRNVQAAR